VKFENAALAGVAKNANGVLGVAASDVDGAGGRGAVRGEGEEAASAEADRIVTRRRAANID
jgi:hypothetical protein